MGKDILTIFREVLETSHVLQRTSEVDSQQRVNKGNEQQIKEPRKVCMHKVLGLVVISQV